MRYKKRLCRSRNQIYLNTARLLTQVAPIVLRNDACALKGGTAINLFVRDMPLLSVDLGLVLPDHTLSREQNLTRISDELRDSSARLRKLGFTVNIGLTDAELHTFAPAFEHEPARLARSGSGFVQTRT